MTQKNLFLTKNNNKKKIIMVKFPRKDMKKTFCSQYYKNYDKTSFTVASC